MREIASQLVSWHDAGLNYAIATLINTGGSAPLPVGSAMAVASDGAAVGSVSGGCVEGAVYELCQQVLASGVAVRESFGYSDDTAFAVGLTCGGTVEVFVQPAPPVEAVRAVASGEVVAIAHLLSDAGSVAVVWPARHSGSLGPSDVDEAVIGEARAMLDNGTSGVRPVRCRQGVEVFVDTHAAPPRMLIFGAMDYANAVATAGKFLGYRVTVCDARPVFATPERVPAADEVVSDWPHRYLSGTEVDARTAIIVLTHDAKFDVPLLEVALRLPVGYVGAMGSRRTHLERLDRLRDAGVTTDELDRLHSPIGLDLGARTPAETAISIAAEIVAMRRGGRGASLSESEVPIHR
jgi:xanthine dehydrogenase accessory factor